jgi:aryl-alcohol dehydrogenase-like predicted oxidoreductase
MNELGLGTVQFGGDYGVSNRSGRTPPDEVKAVLSCAQEMGIAVLDTAPAYGESESIIGEALPATHPFRLVTKLLPADVDNISEALAMRLFDRFEESLEKLRVPSVYAVLVHRTKDLLSDGGERIAQGLAQLQRAGKIQKWGVSVYTAREIDEVFAKYPPDQSGPRVVQLPLSILDQRLIHSGHIKSLSEAQVEIHSRSVFLQGLLLMQLEALDPYFAPFTGALRAFHDACAANHTAPRDAALNFVRCVPGCDVVLVGVNTAAQLRELATSHDRLPECVAQTLACEDPRLLNPSNWTLKGAHR